VFILFFKTLNSYKLVFRTLQNEFYYTNHLIFDYIKNYQT